ncbi:MAG: hypothetical protein AAF911_10250 [Planctomycetota bacterium]
MFKAWIIGISLLGAGSAVGAIPDLSNAQQVQLDTADDTRPPDEPAWTGLLANVASWDPAEAVRNDVPGSTVPDYTKLLAEPEAYRGDLFVIKGAYAGRQRVMPTVRSGPWGDSLVEWGVGVDSDTVAMVYFVNPDGEMTPPREGQTVRLIARFYKLWVDVDADGVERTYPVFVGRSAAIVGQDTGGRVGAAVLVGSIIILAGVLFLVMMLRARLGGQASRREKVQARLRDEAESWAEDAGHVEPLPDDPAEALEQLEQHRG